jgi:hypothetical protein
MKIMYAGSSKPPGLKKPKVVGSRIQRREKQDVVEFGEAIETMGLARKPMSGLAEWVVLELCVRVPASSSPHLSIHMLVGCWIVFTFRRVRVT